MLTLTRQIVYIAMNMVAMNTVSTIGCTGNQCNTQQASQYACKKQTNKKT